MLHIFRALRINPSPHSSHGLRYIREGVRLVGGTHALWHLGPLTSLSLFAFHIYETGPDHNNLGAFAFSDYVATQNNVKTGEWCISLTPSLFPYFLAFL
jgi:hypothetical protein